MAFVNEIEKQISAKIVYFGSELAGKRSNLRFLYENFPDSRGKVLRLDRKDDALLFMEFIPKDFGKIGPYTFRVHLYSPLNELKDRASLQALFRGVDGAVLVADSQEEHLDENKRFLKVMGDTLSNLKMSMKGLPFVLQFSKSDLPGALPEEDLDEELNEFNVPFYSANAVTGVRVEETYGAVARLAYRKIRDELKAKNFSGWYKFTALEALLKKNFDHITDYARDLASPAFVAEELAHVAEGKGVAAEFEGIEKSGELDELDALLEASGPAEAAPPSAEANLDDLFAAEAEHRHEDSLGKTILSGHGKAIRDLVENMDALDEEALEPEGVKTVVSKAKKTGPAVSTAPAKETGFGSKTVKFDRSQLSLGEEAEEETLMEMDADAGVGGEERTVSVPIEIPALPAGKELRIVLELKIRFR
jgi:signal recognition particle receptor subunit beta